jgi:cell division protein FtsB
MDGDYYRKPLKRNWFKGVGTQLFKTRRRGIITMLAAILLLYLLVDNKGIIARLRLELQLREMVQKVEQAEQETKKLQSELKALQGDRKTIEQVAREKHGMVREGETVYRVKKD